MVGGGILDVTMIAESWLFELWRLRSASVNLSRKLLYSQTQYLGLGGCP
jgi:hypothetical protein